METTIVIAIIGSITTILAALITKWAETSGRERNWFQPSEARKNALGGAWVGGGLQREMQRDGKVEKDVALGMKLTLEVTNKKSIAGEWLYWLQIDGQLAERHLVGSGRFRDIRFFEFEYDNQDRTIVQFGYLILELSADGRYLNGEFLAYGRSGNIVSGIVHLEKHVPNKPIDKSEILQKTEADIISSQKIGAGQSSKRKDGERQKDKQKRQASGL